MVSTIRTTLRDSAAARWAALFIVSFTMMCGYFLSDIMSPLVGLLESQLGWSRADYGTYTSSYGWFNVFLLMLILGGIILDKLGIAVRTGHHCAQPVMDQFHIPGTVRASLAMYNTKEEVDALVAGVKRAIGMLV